MRRGEAKSILRLEPICIMMRNFAVGRVNVREFVDVCVRPTFVVLLQSYTSSPPQKCWQNSIMILILCPACCFLTNVVTIVVTKVLGCYKLLNTLFFSLFSRKLHKNSLFTYLFHIFQYIFLYLKNWQHYEMNFDQLV